MGEIKDRIAKTNKSCLKNFYEGFVSVEVSVCIIVHLSSVGTNSEIEGIGTSSHTNLFDKTTESFY